MLTSFSKKSAFLKTIAVLVAVQFVVSSVPLRGYANNDKLRQSAGLTDNNPARNGILDALKVDLHGRAKKVVASIGKGNLIKVYNYNKEKNGYDVTSINKEILEELLANDQIGLIEDEENPGKYIWARKDENGAVITKNGELFISGRINTYPTIVDVPLNRLDLPRYSKVVPLVYQFFKAYCKGEYSWISEILTNAKVLLVPSDSLGEQHFSFDKATKTIKIEKDFMDYLLNASTKRVGMGLFAKAAIAISDKEIAPEKAKEIVNRIAQVSLSGFMKENRLEDMVYIYNLKKEIDAKSRTNEVRNLTSLERQRFLIDQMERTRSFNGRRAAEMLLAAFGAYGEVTPEAAEADLRKIAEAHPQEVVIEKYDLANEKKENKVDKYLDRTDSFRLDSKHLADLNLIKGRSIVLDYEVDFRDAGLFGGKTANTGGMQWLPHLITLQMFATAGRCFRTELIEQSGYKAEFDGYAKGLKDGIAALEKEYGKESKSEEYYNKRTALIQSTADKFQKKLDWGIASISPGLVVEIKQALDVMAKSLGVSVFQLILAIRSSAGGEDSEKASFAGRQDTSLFVTPLMEEFQRMNLKPEDYGYTWEDLKKSHKPWYDILAKARKKLGDKIVTEKMYEVFIKEWLANQRSLFNKRSIEYRLEKGIPVFTDDVEMSSMFQVQANTDFGYVALGVNKSTGYPELQIEFIEAQTNPLVDGSGLGDSAFGNYFGADPLRYLKIADSREKLHVPNIFGKETVIDGVVSKGGIFVLDFPKELEGLPAIGSLRTLIQVIRGDAELSRNFGSSGLDPEIHVFSDIEGGIMMLRDEEGNIRFMKDPKEPDGLAKDHMGNPRPVMVKFQTQIRAEADRSFKNHHVIEQRWLELKEDDYNRAVAAGKVLYTSQVKTQGAAKGEVFILDKEHPETWGKAINKIMVTHQSDPDMNEIMRHALAVIAAVGGRNSHTMIVATEYGLIAISGIGDIKKFRNGQRVTVDASRGVILDGDDYELVPAGRDYNVQELGILPDGFGLGLNLISVDVAHKAHPLSELPSFTGSGLVRLEGLEERIGASGEGLLRFDNYKIHTLLTKLDKGELSQPEKWLLNKMFEIKRDFKDLKPILDKDNHIKVTLNGKDVIYNSGLEFYSAYVEDLLYPRYDPGIPEDLKEIKVIEKLLGGRFILGEQRYKSVLSNGLRSLIEPLIPMPLTILVKAQKIQDTELRNKALDIAEEYRKTFNELDGALPTDEILERTKELISSFEGKISENDSDLLNLIERHLNVILEIRFDDFKSDEYLNVTGTDLKEERNPMAGLRGLFRFIFENTKISLWQLDAIKKLVDIGARRDENGNPVGPGRFRIGVFAPMVSDVNSAKEMIRLCDENGLTADRVLRGIMTETPQVMEIRKYLELALAFGSFGGNDATQFGYLIERQLAASWFFSEALTERGLPGLRTVYSLANEIKRGNEIRISRGMEEFKIGYCGNWPAIDPVGTIILFLAGYDSASITIPSMDRTNNDLYNLLDHMYGHNTRGILKIPKNDKGKVEKEQIAQDLYRLMEDKNSQEGLEPRLINMFPMLRKALNERHFNIYDQINPDAKPKIETKYAKGSISAFHVSLPFHYRLLEEFERGSLRGDLFPSQGREYYLQQIKEQTILRVNLDKQIKKLSEKMAFDGDSLKPEMDKLVADITKCEGTIKDAHYRLKSIELREMLEGFLARAGYDSNSKLSQGEPGKRFYIDHLKEFWRQQAQEAKEKGEIFIVETSKEPADFDKIKSGGDRYELAKEPNPDIGNKGMKKVLHPDKAVFKWELEAIKELKEEGLDNIALALSNVREISEIRDTLYFINRIGLDGIQLGIVVNSPNLMYIYDEILGDKKNQISFLLLDREAKRELASAKMGREWLNVNSKKPLITDDDVNEALKDVTIPVTKTAAEKYGVKLYLGEQPTNKIVDTYKFLETLYADTKFHNNFSEGYIDLMGSLKDLLEDSGEGGEGALVIRAKLLLENVGSLFALKKIKDANPNFKIVVWAEEQSEFDKVMSIGDLIDVMSMGLDSALNETEIRGIPLGRTMLLGAKADEKKMDELLSINAGLRTMIMNSPSAEERNVMAFAFGKSIAWIFHDKAQVVEKYENLIKNNRRQISGEVYDKLLDLTGQISVIPLIKVNEGIAELQRKYEIAVEAVGISG